jgi:hypothetical protein
MSQFVTCLGALDAMPRVHRDGSQRNGRYPAPITAIRAAPTSATTTRAGSLLCAVGNDWDGATARTLGANQSMTHQWTSTGSGDTYWVQKYNCPIANAGTIVQLNDTAPTADRWNFAAVELVAASTGKNAAVNHMGDASKYRYGTALGANQLNATTAVPGTFVDTPPSGTVPGAGAGPTLSVTFTPTNTPNYNVASATVLITVQNATPVPDVVNQTQAAATTAITGAGLIVGAVTNTSGATVPSGSVITTRTSASTRTRTTPSRRRASTTARSTR